MAIKDTAQKLQGLLQEVQSDLVKASEGNMAAAQRVRTGTIKLEKVAKLYRKESVSASKSGEMKKAKLAKRKAKKAPKAAAKAAPKKAAKAKPAAKKAAKQKRPAAKKSAAKKPAAKRPASKAKKKGKR